MGAQRFWCADDYVADASLAGYRPFKGARLFVLAADYDRDVAEAETRGWNAAVEAAEKAVTAERDRWLKAADSIRDFDSDTEMTCRAYAESHAADLALIAALRKPEVEG